MASLAAAATGNLSSSSTWKLIDPTSLSIAATVTTGLTTAFVSSAAFTPGVIIVDGIGVRFSSRVAAPGAQTISVRLAIAGVAVTGTTVTINTSDIDATGNGWGFFKFTAPVTLLAATAYTVQAMGSVNNTAVLLRSAVAADWARFLRTTTTQAPATGDNLFVQGEMTGAGAQNAFTITMDRNDSANALGTLDVSRYSTFSWGNTAATSYYLKSGGSVNVWSASTYNMVTTNATSAKHEFASATVAQFGFIANPGSTVTMTDATSIIDRALLTADVIIGATSLTTNVSTGWKSGDNIVIASTTRTAADTELKAASGNAAGTGVPIAALAAAHSGTSPTQAEAINLSRKTQIFGTGAATTTGFLFFATTATVAIAGLEIYNMGSANANTRGIDVATTTGSVTIQNCSIHDFTATSAIGFNLTAVLTTGNVTVQNNVCYNFAGSALTNPSGATSLTSLMMIKNNIFMKNASAGLINISNCKITYTGNTAISATTSGVLLTDVAYDNSGIINTNVAHSNTTVGVAYGSIEVLNPVAAPTMFGSLTSWRNNTSGITFNLVTGLVLDSLTLFGNTTANISVTGNFASCTLSNLSSTAGATLTTPIGFALNGGFASDIIFDNCTFGPHTTGDIDFTAKSYANIVGRNCNFNSTTTVSTQTNMLLDSQIRLQRINTTAGNHKLYKKFGTFVPDSVIFSTGTPSTRLTPNSAVDKLTQSMNFPLKNGESATFEVYLRKSVVGDGTAYNGNQPRIVLKANPALGYASDTVLATADNTFNGAFQKLSATVSAPTDDAIIQLVVDCDGTTGWVNVDDAKFSGVLTLSDVGSQKYWDNGTPATILPPPIVRSLIARGLIL